MPTKHPAHEQDIQCRYCVTAVIAQHWVLTSNQIYWRGVVKLRNEELKIKEKKNTSTHVKAE